MRDTTTKFRGTRTKKEKDMRYPVLLATMALGVAMRSVGQAMTEFKKGLATGGPEEPGPPKEPRASDERTNVH